MKNYAIELEFFVKQISTGEFVPACDYTSNLDGNPVVGELRTKIHSNVYDLIFELKKLIYIESEKLAKLGCNLCLVPSIQVSNAFLKKLRESEKFVDNKNLRVLKELSVYGKNTGHVLPKNIFKASLQINLSDNSKVSHHYRGKDDETKSFEQMVSNVFDYYSVIKSLDTYYIEEIQSTKRVKGVYAIKSGEYGNRIEYRSLPNNIDLELLLSTLIKAN